jgi:hypothetical protein
MAVADGVGTAAGVMGELLLQLKTIRKQNAAIKTYGNRLFG